MSRPERKKKIPTRLSSDIYVLTPAKTKSPTEKAPPKKKKKEVKTTPRLLRKGKSSDSSNSNLKDENADPSKKAESISRPRRNKLVSTGSRSSVVASKLHSSKDGKTLMNKKTFVAMKSPVLRDRTNTSMELTRDEPVKKTDKIPTKESKEGSVQEKKRVPTGKIAKANQAVPEKGKSKTLKRKTPSPASLENESTPPALLKNKSSGITEIEKSLETKDTEENNIRIIEESEGNVKNVEETNKDGVSKRILRSGASRENSVGSVKENAVPVKKNKFFKSRTAEPGSNRPISPPKKKKMVKKVSRVTNYRQTKLTDSFSTMAVTKQLRPRRQVKNYLESTETSIMLEKHVAPEKRNSIVVLEKLAEGERIKKPVYKLVKTSENHVNDKNKIYEFNFDANDPMEKVTNKKKKRVTRKPTIKRAKKNQLEKPLSKDGKDNTEVVVPAETSEKTKIPDHPHIIPEIVIDRVSSPIRNDFNDAPDHNDIEDVQQPQALQGLVQNQVALPEKSPPSKTAKNVGIPIVASVERLQNDKKINFAPKSPFSRQTSGTFNPFRATNAFKSRPTLQERDMRDHSLLNKSLSPIKNIINDFNPGSPWRPPVLSTFSRIKQVFQSTPLIKKHSNVFSRSTLDAGLNRKPNLGQNEILDENDENADVNIQKLQKKIEEPVVGMKTTAVASNKRNVAEAKNIPDGKANENELKNLDPEPIASFSNDTLDFPAFDDYTENQENIAANQQTPKKSPIKKKKTFAVDRPGLQNKQNRLPFEPIAGPSGLQKKQVKPIPGPSWVQNKDFEPAPGPSGLQKHNSLNQSTVLRQASLNKFLNLQEMPESTRIGDADKIYGDIHSTPIRAKPMKKVLSEANIENAFGFDEEESDIEISPILKKEKPAERPVLKEIFRNVIRKVNDSQRHKVKSSSNTARLSVGEIKKTLMPEVLKKKNALVEKLQKVNEIQKKEVTTMANFSDTFDLLLEKEQSMDSDAPSQLPLFADLQPAHFTKPPRHSYVRTRKPKRNYPEDEEDEEDDEDEGQKKPEAKKKKVNKLKKQEMKRINDWAKSLNDTFQEIDEFPLVIERLS